MKLFNFPPGYVNFIILAPLLLKGTGGKPMSAAEIMQQFQGNTVVVELPEGKAYDYIRADGVHFGIHPQQGKVRGSWQVGSDGKTCVTWAYASGSVTNCGTVESQGKGTYRWGDRTLKVEPGDVRKLGQ
jgi:hypothetical protein